MARCVGVHADNGAGAGVIFLGMIGSLSGNSSLPVSVAIAGICNKVFSGDAQALGVVVGVMMGLMGGNA